MMFICSDLLGKIRNNARNFTVHICYIHVPLIKQFGSDNYIDNILKSHQNDSELPRCLTSPVSTLPLCLNFFTSYVLSPQLLMIPRREKVVPRQYRFLRYTRRFFFSSSFRSFVRLKYSQKVIVYKSRVELFL